MRRSRVLRSEQHVAGSVDDYAEMAWAPPEWDAIVDPSEPDEETGWIAVDDWTVSGEGDQHWAVAEHAASGLPSDDWYAYGRGRVAATEPEPDFDPIPLDPGEIATGLRNWVMHASGLAYTDAGLDRAFRLLECALAAIYFWFGVLKLFPAVSPAEDLVGQTIQVLTAHQVPFRAGVVTVGLFEIGLAWCLWWFPGRRWVLGLTFAHLCATFVPFAVVPELLLGHTPGSLTLAGQYIVKNLVLLASVWAALQYHRGRR